MLYALFSITLVFLVLNFLITGGDYLHPSTLFCEVFAVDELICIIGQSAFQITLHIETVYVLTCGFIAFTLGGLLSIRKTRISGLSLHRADVAPCYIHVSEYWILLLIVLQIMTQYFFIKYLKAIAEAWGDGGDSLGEMISLYDTMTKFWKDIFDSLNVSIPMGYRVLNPITNACAWLVLYIAVNNFFVARKVKKSHILVVLLMCSGILLNGSRSPLLRVITFVIIMVYIYNYKYIHHRKGDCRVFFRLMFITLSVSLIMILLLRFMGRNKGINNILTYTFIYTGAPIVNLDNFLQKWDICLLGGETAFFGEHTFKAGYSYLSKLLGFPFSMKVEEIGGFAFSNNGIEIGNVYTTYNVFAFDFGYLGIFPLVFTVALYYTCAYKKILRNNCPSGTVDFRLFIYSYLFNDLIMLSFSNRFFTTILDAPFIKLLVISWLIKILFEHRIYIGRYRLRLMTKS